MVQSLEYSYFSSILPGAISSEEIIKYAHRISASNAVCAPLTWVPGNYHVYDNRFFYNKAWSVSGLTMLLHSEKHGFIRVTLFSAAISNIFNKHRCPKFCMLYMCLQKAMKLHAAIN